MRIATILRCFIAPILLGFLFAMVTTSCSTERDEKALKMPLTATFGKGTPGGNEGPYAVTLTNTSTNAITVTATIGWSVTDHSRTTQTVLPPQEIPAGEGWTINDLATEDRIMVTADGFEPLELTTPPGE